MNDLKRLAGKKILVVDDEPDLREPLATEFESLGCVVFQAGNGREAFQIVQRESVDVVVSDIRMPGGDGVELLRNIKSLHHAFPIVMFITGFSDLSREEAYHLGAEAILAKPFDLDELDEALVRVLTPPEERWAGLTDRAKLNNGVEYEFARIEEAIAHGNFAIGRGGFFVRQSDRFSVPGERVSIKIRFREGDFSNLEGGGIVRWVRRQAAKDLPAGCGIEFETLNPESRAAVFDLSSRFRVVPFIPKN